MYPTSAEPNFHRGYEHLVPEINIRSSRLKGYLQKLGYVDMMATEGNPTRYDSIKIFEEQNTKNNGQRERKHLKQKQRSGIWIGIILSR